MNHSGGLLWHWQAWRSRALWRPTCQQISSWLAPVRPRASQLLLIGASAGWMMPTAWLERFDTVTTWDIDPLAAPLFRWRHASALQAAGTELRCHTGDALAGLGAVLRAHPQACVLFDNVLGQYRFHCTNVDQAATRIDRIVRTLRGREWGSLHDAFSGPVGSVRAGALPAMQSRVQGSKDAVAADQRWLGQLGAKGEWLDHLTSAVFEPGTLVQHMAWAYRPGYWHWLQAAWVQNAGPAV